MPSSFTNLLKLELPATGELTGLWGQTVNNAITTPVSEAIAGTQSITIGGSDYTLSNGNGSASNEARKAVIVATGSPGADRNVICPATSKLYLFINNTNAVMTLKTASGTGVAVSVGLKKLLYCDGTNVVEAANAFGELTLAGAAQTVPVAVAFSSGSMTVDCNLSNVFTTVMSGNSVAPTISNERNGQTINWFIAQDGVGNRTISWPASFKWVPGASTSLSTTANAVDLLVATYIAGPGFGFWYATLVKGY